MSPDSAKLRRDSPEIAGEQGGRQGRVKKNNENKGKQWETKKGWTFTLPHHRTSPISPRLTGKTEEADERRVEDEENKQNPEEYTARSTNSV